jgi:hypothetical protein
VWDRRLNHCVLTLVNEHSSRELSALNFN